MANITVTGDIGGYKGGQVLTADRDIADYYRAIVNEGADEKITLSDSDILAIVNAVDGDDEEAEFKRVEMMERGEVPQEAPEGAEPASDISISGMAGKAKSWVDTAIQDKDVRGLLDNAQYLKETIALAPKVLYHALAKALGSKFDELPEPGTTIDGREVRKQPTKASNNPDIYFVRGKTSAGKPTDVPHSLIDDFARSFPQAISLQESIDKVSGKDAKGDEMTKARVQARDKARLQSFLGCVKTAINIGHQVRAANDYPGITFEWDMVYDDKGRKTADYAQSFKPAIITNTNNRTEFYFLSVTDFLRLDFDAAKEAGGTCKVLMATLDRETKDAKAKFVIENFADWKGAVLSVSGFLNDSDDNFVFAKRALSKRTADNYPVLANLKALSEMLDAIVSPNLKWLEEMEAKSEAANKKAVA